MKSGSQVMIQCLKENNVEYIFGYPGLAVCPFYESLADSDLKHILVRQEQHAGHMANGYARVSGKPGVCITTSGPGATNLITALATAYIDSIPMIAITGQVSKDLLGTDSFQEADVFGCTQPFVKHSYMVMDANDLARVINEAFYIASSGRPGPVLIDVPMDVQDQMVEYHQVDKHVNILSYDAKPEIDEDQIQRAVNAINKSKRPLICVGGGVHLSNAREKIVEFSEKTGIPAVATMMGIGTFPTLHPNYFGMLGLHGKPYANKAIKESDTVIILGARVGNRTFGNPKSTNQDTVIIHVDIDPAEISKNTPAHIPIIGDILDAIEALMKHSPKANSQEFFQDLQEYKDKYKPDFSERESTLNPKAFVRMLSESMADDGIYCADVGQNQIWSSNNLIIKEGRFLTSGGMGCMGYAIPCAIGAKLANKDAQVYAVCGDGGFQMSMSELATAMYYNINIKIVVMNNTTLGMVKEAQVKKYKRISGVDLGNTIDICALAKAFSIDVAKVDNLEDGKIAIKKMIDSQGMFLVECIVDSDEKSL